MSSSRLLQTGGCRKTSFRFEESPCHTLPGCGILPALADNTFGSVKMDSAHQMAMQVVLDALAPRGPGDGDGPFRMVAIDPNYWPAERLRLTRRYGRMVPTSATEATAAVISKSIAPHLRRELEEGSLGCQS